MPTPGEDEDHAAPTQTGLRPLGELTPSEVRDAQQERHQCLLVFERELSWMFQLPAEGEVVIGRGDAAGLRLRDTSVSRRHAQLLVDDQGVIITDLGSQNGTRVNGERLVADRVLQVGDSISICGARLVLYASAAVSARASGTLLELEPLRERVLEELERSLRHQRPFTLLVGRLRHAAGDREPLSRQIVSELRRLDSAAWLSAGELMVLVPEAGADEAAGAAARLRAVLSRIDGDARVGYTVCPTDGCEAEGLEAAARAAAAGAPARSVAPAATSFGTFRIGGRDVVVADPAMSRLYALVERLAVVDLPVLIIGETGSGKELAASALHERSRRRTRPLVAVNCAAIQENLVESELFGHERGAFSGAVATKPGLFESAAGGTVFLDEIGELALSIQAKLLRVLETRRVTRVGDVHEREIDIRLVAATHRDLRQEVKAGRFRQDLYFRLGGATLSVPPLRARARELPLLAQLFLSAACRAAGRPAMEIATDAMAALAAHDWPGNVRELRNLMDYVAAAYPDTMLTAAHVRERLAVDQPAPVEAPVAPAEAAAPAPARGAPREFRPLVDELRELEIRRINEALEAAGGNATKAAELIGMPLRTFFARLKAYDLRK